METWAALWFGHKLRFRLETFLVEWKPATIQAISHLDNFLETFLVEWKLQILRNKRNAQNCLETFLVEWKPGPPFGSGIS